MPNLGLVPLYGPSAGVAIPISSLAQATDGTGLWVAELPTGQNFSVTPAGLVTSSPNAGPYERAGGQWLQPPTVDGVILPTFVVYQSAPGAPGYQFGVIDVLPFGA